MGSKKITATTDVIYLQYMRIQKYPTCVKIIDQEQSHMAPFLQGDDR